MEQQQAEQPRVNRKRKLIIAGVLLAIIGGGLVYWLLTRGSVTTDDAQIDGDLVPISPRVAGYVRVLNVDDNQRVQAGYLLLELDRRDLNAKLSKAIADVNAQQAQTKAAGGQVAVVERSAPAGERQAEAVVAAAQEGVTAANKQIDVAQAQLTSAQAGVSSAQSGVASALSAVDVASAQVSSAQSALQEAQAQVESAQAQAEFAASEVARFSKMYSSGAVSKQQLENLQTANKKAQADLKAALDRVTNARGNVQQQMAKRTSAEAGVKQANASLASARAAASQAQSGVALARTSLEQSRARLAETIAARSGSQTAPEQIAVSKEQQKAAAAKIAQSEADVRNAQLQLSYTLIKAPVTGIVSEKNVELGQYVQPGQALMAIVPLKNVWVVANFKETQIEKMRSGQRAIVHVDTYPGMEFEGRVQSIGAATSAKFSLLPPENATGNYVKVVQRIPVKIVFVRPLPSDVVLRPGQNVVATVYMR